MSATVNWLAVGFTCPEKLKKFDPFTFSAVPSKNTNTPVTLLELPTSAVDTPFTTDVPDILSEKSASVDPFELRGPRHLGLRVGRWVRKMDKGDRMEIRWDVR